MEYKTISKQFEVRNSNIKVDELENSSISCLSLKRAEKTFKKIAQNWKNKNFAELIQVFSTFERYDGTKLPFTDEIQKNNFISILQSGVLIEECTQFKLSILSFVGYLMYSSNDYILFFLKEGILEILQTAIINDFRMSDIVCSTLFNMIVDKKISVLQVLSENAFDFSPIVDFILYESSSMCVGIKNLILQCINTPFAPIFARILIESVIKRAAGNSFCIASTILVKFFATDGLREICIEICNELKMVESLIDKFENFEYNETADLDIFGSSMLLSACLPHILIEINIQKLEEIASFALRNCNHAFASLIHFMGKLIDLNNTLADKISNDFIVSIKETFNEIWFVSRDECLVFLLIYATNCNKENFEFFMQVNFLDDILDILESDLTSAEYVLNFIKRVLIEAEAKGRDFFDSLISETDIIEKVQQILESEIEDSNHIQLKLLSQEIITFVDSLEDYESD